MKKKWIFTVAQPYTNSRIKRVFMKNHESNSSSTAKYELRTKIIAS